MPQVQLEPYELQVRRKEHNHKERRTRKEHIHCGCSHESHYNPVYPVVSQSICSGLRSRLRGDRWLQRMIL